MVIIKFLAKLAFFILALIMFLPAKLAYFDGADQKKWVATQATITKSQLGVVTTEEKLAEDKEKGFIIKDEYKPSFYWDVEYSYKYDNQEYSRAGIYVLMKSTDDKKTRHMTRAAKHPVGSKITVYVNPKDVDEAYIDRRTEGGIETWYNVTRFFFYLSILLFFTPAFRWLYKELKEDKVVKTVDTQTTKENIVKKPEPTVQRKNANDDGFTL